MPWSAILLAVIGLVGPLVSRLLEQWLDDQLRAAMPRVGRTTGDPEADTLRLLTAVRGQLWFFQFGKRRLLDSLIAGVPRGVAAGGLTAVAEIAIRDAAATA